MTNDTFARLVEASDAYYNGSPIMSDVEFDALQETVERMYPNHPVLKTIGAPSPDGSGWTKQKHQIPMGSLTKVTTEKELSDWFRRPSRDRGMKVLSEKLDGISIDLEYIDGKMTNAITRGDGEEGENITSNVLKMNGYPMNLPVTEFVAARGEIVILEENFNALNEILVKRGEKPYKNMRNCVSGMARRHDGMYSEFLTIKFYDVSYDRNKIEIFDWLKFRGFQTSTYYSVVSVEDIMKIYNRYIEKDRQNLDYIIDGLVIDIDDKNIRNSLGITNQRPKYAVALKFPSLSKSTMLEDIEWQVGKGGRITPVAHLQPVKIDGITIKRASLHNLDNIKNMAFRYGDEVLVSRRNDVIPYVEKVLVESLNKLIGVPERCPECRSKIYGEGAYLVCKNPECKGNLFGSLMKWVEKSGMTSQGMGSSTIEKLYDAGLVTYPNELYLMTPSMFLKLDGFQKRSAQKMYDIIQSHREVSLADFIGGLNLGSFGSSLAQRLVDAGYDTIEMIQDLPLYSLMKIDGIGETRAQEFIDSLYGRVYLIPLLLEQVTIKEKEMAPKASGSIFNGKSFCFTGAIQKVGDDGKRLKRKDMEAIVNNNGGSISAVKSGLTYLVQADPESQSSKTKKATSLGITILAESDFFKMLGD